MLVDLPSGEERQTVNGNSQLPGGSTCLEGALEWVNRHGLYREVTLKQAEIRAGWESGLGEEEGQE